MSGDSPRIQELRRRVQADPASIAFAQLAEECRRAGSNEEAVDICRAGLGYHPDYLLARVTLGRALVELSRYDEAQQELERVLSAAPDNSPAIRAMAEVLQQRGQMAQALEFYRRALSLAQYDPELESAVERIQGVVAPPPPKPAAPAVPVKVEDLFDFDTLLEQLGGRPSTKEERSRVPEVPQVPVPKVPRVPEVPTVPGAVDRVELKTDDADPLAVLEQQLRDAEVAPAPYQANVNADLAQALRETEARHQEEQRRAREAERAEAEREEAARLEAELADGMRRERERRDAERLEGTRINTVRREAERAEAHRFDVARLEAARVEAARLEAERLEAARINSARRDAERAEAHRFDAARLQAERLEAQRLEAERIENVRREAVRAEAERLAAERAALERRERLILAELQQWLDAIEAGRAQPHL